MTGWDGNVEAHASTLPRLEGHKWRPALQIEWRMRAEMSWSSVCGRWDMAIVQRPHNPPRQVPVKIEYNQSGYTNSETSPSTPRRLRRVAIRLSPTPAAPRSGLAKRNGNTHQRLQITRRARLNFRKAQANGEGSSDDLFVGQILQIRHTRLTVDLATPISLQSPKASPHETTSAALP